MLQKLRARNLWIRLRSSRASLINLTRSMPWIVTRKKCESNTGMSVVRVPSIPRTSLPINIWSQSWCLRSQAELIWPRSMSQKYRSQASSACLASRSLMTRRKLASWQTTTGMLTVSWQSKCPKRLSARKPRYPWHRNWTRWAWRESTSALQTSPSSTSQPSILLKWCRARCEPAWTWQFKNHSTHHSYTRHRRAMALAPLKRCLSLQTNRQFERTCHRVPEPWK